MNVLSCPAVSEIDIRPLLAVLLFSTKCVMPQDDFGTPGKRTER